MSQSTAEDFLNNTLGMKAVSVDVPGSRADASVLPPRKRNVWIAILSTAILAVGFKVMGDYACDRAIDAWAARQQAAFTQPTPAAIAFFERAAQEESAEQAPVAVEPAETTTLSADTGA